MRGGASKRRPWGRWFRRWGGGRGARGVAKCCNLLPRAGRGGWSFNLFQNVSILFPSPPPPRKSSHAGPRGSKAGPAVAPGSGAPRPTGTRRRSETSSVFIRSRSALFGIVRVRSASSLEVKLMEEFLKHSEIPPARPPDRNVGGILRQIATHCGGLRHLPQPRRHTATDHSSVSSAALRTTRGTSPGEIHGA